MLIEYGAWLIGDPHHGKEFKTGVPIHRRGEREENQFAEFERQLKQGESYNIMVGDLFDKPFVPLPLIYRVAKAYRAEASRRPGVLFVVMAGNHDISRQLTSMGAFHILALCLEDVSNILVLFEPATVGDFSFFPWEWDRTAKDQIKTVTPAKIAVGHWDLKDFGGNVDHMCPAEDLHSLGYQAIYSGHYHVAGPYEVEGFEVVCTGSMQPYTHAEDPEGNLYITVTPEQLEEIRPEDLRHKNVRVLLAPGENLPTDVDCLSLTSKRTEDTTQVEIHEVGLGDFNLDATLGQQFEQFEVPDNVRQYIKERVHDST